MNTQNEKLSAPHQRRRRLAIVAVGLVTALALAGTAAANGGGPSASVQLPYQAELVNAAGEPLDGTYDLIVRVYDGGDPQQAALLWEESFAAERVDDGRLSVVIGTGTALSGQLDAELFAAHPQASIALEIDGQSLGQPALIGTVPRAMTAERVAASAIAFGGADGLVPAEAVERTVEVFSGVYASGDTVPTVAGWDCAHHVTSVNPIPSMTSTPTTLHRFDMWIGHVGPGKVEVNDHYTHDFGAVPANRLVIRHVYTQCDPNVDLNCTYLNTPAPDERARVQTICVAP